MDQHLRHQGQVWQARGTARCDWPAPALASGRPVGFGDAAKQSSAYFSCPPRRTVNKPSWIAVTAVDLLFDSFSFT